MKARTVTEQQRNLLSHRWAFQPVRIIVQGFVNPRTSRRYKLSAQMHAWYPLHERPCNDPSSIPFYNIECIWNMHENIIFFFFCYFVNPCRWLRAGALSNSWACRLIVPIVSHTLHRMVNSQFSEYVYVLSNPHISIFACHSRINIIALSRSGTHDYLFLVSQNKYRCGEPCARLFPIETLEVIKS